jgi:hypothetical protein
MEKPPDISSVNVKQIMEEAKSDPALLSTLDINSLLKAIDEKNTDYLENKTLEDVNRDVFDAVNQTPLDDAAKEKMIKSLLGYRYVSEIYELHLGKAVQLMKKRDDMPKLIMAGFVTNIDFLDNGIYLVCKGFKNRMFKYKFDDCYIFQKLAQSEMLILMAYDRIAKLST